MTKQIIFIFALLCTLQAQASVQPVQKDTVRHTIHYEVAELLQLSIKTVEAQMAIALRRLGNCMQLETRQAVYTQFSFKK